MLDVRTRLVRTTALALSVLIQSAGPGSTLQVLGQQRAPSAPPQPLRADVVVNGFRIDELLLDSKALDERETGIFYAYLLAATPRERVAIAADYLAGRRVEAMTREQRVELQKRYDRYTPGFIVGSVEDRARYVNVMVQYYDESVARYGPDQALTKWLDTVQDPNKLMLAVSKMAISPPTLLALSSQVAMLGADYVFDTTVGKSQRQFATAMLDDEGLYWTSSTKLAFGIARLAGSNADYARSARDVLHSFVRPELLDMFKPDALLPRLLEGARKQYETRRTQLVRERAQSTDVAAIPTFDQLLQRQTPDYLGLSKAFQTLFAPAPAPRTGLTPAQWQERIRDYENAQMVFGVISGALSLDPKTRQFGRALARMSDVVFDLAKAAAKRSAENGGVVATGNVVVIAIMAVVTMLQIIGDQNAANAEFQALAGMMSQLSAQIIALHDEMRASFHHVNLRLALLMSELQGVASQLKNLRVVEQDARIELRGRLDAIRSDLDELYVIIDTVPDRVAIDALDREMLRCSDSRQSAEESEECGRQLASFLAQTARATTRQVIPMPSTTASGRELRAWRRSFASSDPASSGSRNYTALSALLGITRAAAVTGVVDAADARAVASQPTVHPALIEHVINRLSDVGLVTPALEKDLRAQLTSAAGSYEALHRHFEKNFDVYARELLKRHEEYRKVYAKEVGRILVDAVTRTSSGPEWSKLARSGSNAASLTAPRADQAAAAKQIEPCEAGDQLTYINPKTLAAFAGKYSTSPNLTRILPLYRAAEALRLGHVEPLCYIASGHWSVPVHATHDELRANIHFQKTFARHWRYAADVQAETGTSGFAAESFKVDFSPARPCWQSCPAFANIEGRAHYKTPTPIPEAWSCAYINDCRRGAVVQKQLSGTKLAFDEKALDPLRKLVAARLIKWRAAMIDVAAQGIAADLRKEGTALNNAMEGMSAFKAALEQLIWFVNERQAARVGPAAALGLNGWLLDEALISQAMESGETLAGLLGLFSIQSAGDAVLNSDEKNSQFGSAWLWDLGVQRNLRNVDIVLTQSRTWVTLMDPKNVLNANPSDDVATRPFQRDAQIPADPPEFVTALRGKLLILENVRDAAMTAVGQR